MTELHEKLARWGHAYIDGEEAIELVRKIWDVGEEEGYWSERGRLAADAVWVAAGHSESVSNLLMYHTFTDVGFVFPVRRRLASGRSWRQDGTDMRWVLTRTTSRRCRKQQLGLKHTEHGERETRCPSVDQATGCNDPLWTLLLALGKPLPKTAEGCAAAPRQFGGATAKMVANPYSTFHKPDFFEILMHT